MRCPRDQSILKEHAEHGVVVHQCLLCHGIWMARRHFHPVLHQAKLPSVLISAMPSVDPAPADCPVGPDRHPLEHRVVRGVPIDFCKHHPGFWLDGGELELLRQRVLQGQKVKPVRAGSSSSSFLDSFGTADVIGGVFELLFEILSGL